MQNVCLVTMQFNNPMDKHIMKVVKRLGINASQVLPNSMAFSCPVVEK